MLLYVFFNDTATTEIYTLSLHDALPILAIEGAQVLVGGQGPAADGIDEVAVGCGGQVIPRCGQLGRLEPVLAVDRKSTRLNSSHTVISYAVFCLKKKKKNNTHISVIYRR